VTSHQCCLQLSELRSGEGASGEDGGHAGLDGGLVGAACFGITDEGDELSGERVHRQADEALLTDGGVDGGNHQRIPERQVVRAGCGRRWCRLGSVTCLKPVQILPVVAVTWIIGDEGVVAEADDAGAGGELIHGGAH